MTKRVIYIEPGDMIEARICRPGYERNARDWNRQSVPRTMLLTVIDSGRIEVPDMGVTVISGISKRQWLPVRDESMRKEGLGSALSMALTDNNGTGVTPLPRNFKFRVTPPTKAKVTPVLGKLGRVREFIESEVDNRGYAGSLMTDYQGEAEEALAELDAVIMELRK